ncbi:hypothetical protein ACE6H2_002910 [Prunus campanulata]
MQARDTAECETETVSTRVITVIIGELGGLLLKSSSLYLFLLHCNFVREA